MLYVCRSTALRSSVVASPQLAETLATHRQLPDELVQLRIVGIGADERPQRRDNRGGGTVPVPVPVTEPRVQEGRSHQVLTGGVVGSERGRDWIRREHVHTSAVHVRGRLVPGRNQLEDPGGHPLRSWARAPPPARGGRGESLEVRGCVVVQL